MDAEAQSPAVAALTHRFLLDYPHEAARLFEAMPAPEAAALLGAQPPHAALRAWQALAPDVALSVLEDLPEPLAVRLLAEAEPVASVAVLTQLDPPARDVWMQRLDREVAHELRDLLSYPDDCAGRMMDPRVSPLRSGMTVAEGIERLRQIRRSGLRELFVIDDEGRLSGRVEVQDLALAAPDLPLADITRGGRSVGIVDCVVHELMLLGYLREFEHQHLLPLGGKPRRETHASAKDHVKPRP
jgi:magnesium transporter